MVIMSSNPARISLILIGILGVLLNLLCAIALFQVRDQWTCHLRIMLSLMFADMLTPASIITTLFSIAFALYYYITGGKHALFVTVINAFNTIGLNATLLNLIYMAIDHYITILHPWRNPISAKICSIIIIII